MARVSRRCQACVDARIQCNLRTPCSRCQALNLSCTTSRKVFKFRDEAPILRQRYLLTPSPSPPKSPPGEEIELPSEPSPRPAECETIALPMDEHVNPLLTVKAISSQQTQIFMDYAVASFPCHFRCTKTHVPVDWVEYVDRRQGSVDSCFNWAVRTCTAAYLGFLHNDTRYIIASQQLYHRALRSLAHLMANEATAKSDDALASAIILAVFEKHNCSSPNAWLYHATGIRMLMKLRGPQAHLEGFGQTMYICYRNFLITAALIEGEACFLEEPEWQALNKQIAANNAKLPNSSLYTDVMERAFIEVLKIPGYVKQIYELQAQPLKERTKVQPALLQDIQATRAALRGIYTEFGVSVSILRSGQHDNHSFIGPVPHFFVERYSSLFARGLRLALLILNYLLVVMDPKQGTTMIDSDEFMLLSDTARSQQVSHLTLEDKLPLALHKSPGRPSIIVRSLITAENSEPPTTDWMDRIITTMGLEAIHVSLDE